VKPVKKNKSRHPLPRPRVALYPGTFDPFTNGHLDIVERALRLFDELIVVVAHSGRKQTLLTTEERVSLIQDILSDYGNVRVVSWDGLIVDYAKKTGAKSLVRGLRAASDFEYEFMMASMNREISSDIDTVFLMTGENLYFVSSTMVKELIRFGGDASPYLPKKVCDYLKKKKINQKN
jgi:pantetheine-phosphate adenylyltransferase